MGELIGSAVDQVLNKIRDTKAVVEVLGEPARIALSEPRRESEFNPLRKS